MKKQFLLLFPLYALVFLTACQKEVSIEVNGTPSVGSLLSDVSGECLPKTVQGIYEAGKALNADSNYIDVQVNVSTPGAYHVFSDTVNGIFFEANGAFATAGLNTVRLKGGGTPQAAGNHNFVIVYDSTQCTVTVSTLAQGGALKGEFTLAGGPDVCMNYVLAGDYIEGVAMTPANTVVISIDVTVLGTYDVATDPANGISFSGTGVLTATGPQTITLTATGTPTVASSTVMAIIPLPVNGTTCNFTVEVTTASTADYFPRTAGSNWSYQYDDNPNDSLFIRSKNGTVTLGGNVYNVFEATEDAAGAGFSDYGNYRKAGSDYHTYLDAGLYFGLDAGTGQSIDYIFLKDNTAAGAGWQSDAINGAIGGTPISIRIAFTIEQKDATVTVGGVDYPNTIVVVEKYQVYDGANWADATPFVGYYKSYYARDIGLIKQDKYFEENNPNPPVIEELDIRRHQVF